MRRPAVGMGEPTYFSFSEIEAYCRLKNIIFPAERERLLRMLDALDREWMRQHIEGREKKSKSQSKPMAPPPSHSPPRHRQQPAKRTEVR